MEETWKHIIERDTPEGAVTALILDFVALQKQLDALREFGLLGDYARVEEALNNLRSVFTQEFNPEHKKA